MLLNFPHRAFKFLERASLKCALFVWKFPREELTTGLQMLCNISVFAPNSNRSKRKKKEKEKGYLARRRQTGASVMKTFPPLLGDNCARLRLRLVYLRIFDHDSMRRRLIPGVLWQFAGWQKGPFQSLKLDQSGQGPEKSVASSWEKIRRDTNFSESHCEVHSGCRFRQLFPLCVCFLTLLLSPALIFFFPFFCLSCECWTAQLKVCEFFFFFIWFWRKKRTPCICSHFQPSLGDLKPAGACELLQGGMCSSQGEPHTSRKRWSN